MIEPEAARDAGEDRDFLRIRPGGQRTRADGSAPTRKSGSTGGRAAHLNLRSDDARQQHARQKFHRRTLFRLITIMELRAGSRSIRAATVRERLPRPCTEVTGNRSLTVAARIGVHATMLPSRPVKWFSSTKGGFHCRR